MYIVHEHKNVIALGLDKVDCKLSCRGTTDEINEKCHTGPSDKGVKRASYFALKKAKPSSSSKDLGPNSIYSWFVKSLFLLHSFYTLTPRFLDLPTAPCQKARDERVVIWWVPSHFYP